MSNKLKKNLIIGSIALGIVGIGITTTLVSCKNNENNNNNNVELKNIIFTNESITNLKDKLISIIDKEKLTKEEFSNDLLKNTKDNFVVNNENIGTSITKAILTDQNIIQLTLNNKNFEYLLDLNFDDKLFTLDLEQNLLSIQLDVTNSSFYTTINVSNLNSLQSTIENYINETNNIFTSSEFTNQLNSDSFKSVIANAINIKSNSIGSITFVDNTLTIAPNSNSKVKFISKSNQDMIEFGSIKLILDDTSFYQEISFNDNVLEELRSNIINEINDKGIIKNNIDKKLSYLLNLINNVKTINNKNLSEYISTPTYSSNSIKITLKDNIGKYKFKTINNIHDISITPNIITLNNINLLTESPENWFTWNGNEITGFIKREETDIILPTRATSIANNVFINNKTIQSVDIPNSVTSIGISAFRGCSKLTSVNIPDGVTSIDNYIFFECSKLTSVNIPNSVTNIGKQVFQGCSNLTEITIPNSVTSIGDNVFQGCFSLTSISIPNSLTLIEYGSFWDCSSLTSINIPNSVTSIGISAFRDCSSLTQINIPNSVTSIGHYAFSGCSNLTSITIPDSITSIGNYAFRNVKQVNVYSEKVKQLVINSMYTGTINIISPSNK